MKTIYRFLFKKHFLTLPLGFCILMGYLLGIRPFFVLSDNYDGLYIY